MSLSVNSVFMEPSQFPLGKEQTIKTIQVKVLDK